VLAPEPGVAGRHRANQVGCRFSLDNEAVFATGDRVIAGLQGRHPAANDPEPPFDQQSLERPGGLFAGVLQDRKRADEQIEVCRFPCGQLR
jgi:hypothetical protein